MEQPKEEKREQPEVEFRSIPLDAVSEGKFRLRQVGDERRMEELRLSIVKRGVLVPIVVAETEEGFELICGRRRVLCARAAKLAEIPAMIVKASAEWRAWACLTENIVREQVNPVDVGLWLSQIMEQEGINQRTLAERLQVSEQYVGQRLTTMKWSDDVREAVLEGQIGFAVGRELWQISEESHRRHLLRVAAVSGCTARQAADWRRAWQREQAEFFPERASAEGVAAAELDQEAEGQCVMCQAELTDGEGHQITVCDTCKKAVQLSSS